MSLRGDAFPHRRRATYLYEEDHLPADPWSPLAANKPICIDRLGWRVAGRAARPPPLSCGSGMERHPDGSLKSLLPKDPRPLIGGGLFSRFFPEAPWRHMTE